MAREDSVWKQEEIDYLKKRFSEKALLSVIASELSEKFKSRDSASVKRKISALKLGSNGSSSIKVDGRKISRGEYLKRKRGKMKKDQRIPETALDFDVLKKLNKGKVGYYPGLGPVISLGEEAMMVSNFSIKATGLREVFSKSAQIKTMYVQAKNFAEKNIRALSTPQQLEMILNYLEKGAIGHKLPRRMDERIAYLDGLTRSGKLKDLADIIIMAYRAPEITGAAAAGTDIGKADQALHLLSSEYAAVMNVPYKQAEALLVQASGKKTIDQLIRPSSLIRDIN